MFRINMVGPMALPYRRPEWDRTPGTARFARVELSTDATRAGAYAVHLGLLFEYRCTDRVLVVGLARNLLRPKTYAAVGMTFADYFKYQSTYSGLENILHQLLRVEQLRKADPTVLDTLRGFFLPSAVRVHPSVEIKRDMLMLYGLHEPLESATLLGEEQWQECFLRALSHYFARDEFLHAGLDEPAHAPA